MEVCFPIAHFFLRVVSGGFPSHLSLASVGFVNVLGHWEKWEYASRKVWWDSEKSQVIGRWLSSEWPMDNMQAPHGHKELRWLFCPVDTGCHLHGGLWSVGLSGVIPGTGRDPDAFTLSPYLTCFCPFSFLCSLPNPLCCHALPRIQWLSTKRGDPHVGVGLPLCLFSSQF